MICAVELEPGAGTLVSEMVGSWLVEEKTMPNSLRALGPRDVMVHSTCTEVVAGALGDPVLTCGIRSYGSSFHLAQLASRSAIARRNILVRNDDGMGRRSYWGTNRLLLTVVAMAI
jgi:hypothetical protein